MAAAAAAEGAASFLSICESGTGEEVRAAAKNVDWRAVDVVAISFALFDNPNVDHLRSLLDSLRAMRFAALGAPAY
jgi:hypothetical protein